MIKCAAIVDEFTLLNISNHWDVFEINYVDTIDEILSKKPDLLFVESLWRGHESSWTGLIDSKAHKLIEIVNAFKKNSIPTVFWGKEDPEHFEDFTDRENIAGLFEYIYTTEIDCVGDYKKLYPNSDCSFLPFFYDEGVFKPSNKKEKEYIFAGAYYPHFSKRCREFEIIIDGILGQGKEIDIFDRNFLNPNTLLRFPEKYNNLIKGTIEAKKIHSVIPKYNCAINLNTVTNGQTMFARRIVETLACGTDIKSNYARSIDYLFNKSISLYHNDLLYISAKNAANYIAQFSSESILREVEDHVIRKSQVKHNNYGFKHLPRKTISTNGLALNIKKTMSTSSLVSATIVDDYLVVNSTLKEHEHAYINLLIEDEIFYEDMTSFIFESNSNKILLDIWFYNNDTPISRKLFSRKQAINILKPNRYTNYKVGIRIQGPIYSSVVKIKYGRKTKIPGCIYPILKNIFELKGSLLEMESKIKSLEDLDAEVFYYTGNDHDFSYHLINSTRVIVGGAKTRESILLGRHELSHIPNI